MAFLLVLISLNLAFLIAGIDAFYPVYKLEGPNNNKEKKAVDTIVMNPVRPRGAFLSPLFGYRFMSLEPSATINVRPIGQQIPAMAPASSEEADGEEEGAEEDEEGILPVANEHQPIPATFSNYDPLFYGPEQKRNFYTHIWRDIVQRMPAYRSHHSRAFQSANGHRERLLEKRNPADRMHAIRMG